MTPLSAQAVLCALVAATAELPPPTAAEEAGAALAAGRLDEAVVRTAPCPSEPACALVRGRALFGLGMLEEAAQPLHVARSGAASVYAAKLEGEALLLVGDGRAALEPLRFAIERDAEGPAGVRAAALLADALLENGELVQAAEQARTAADLPSQPGDVRAGLELIRAEALSGRVDRGEAALAHDAAARWRTFWLDHPEHPAAESARSQEQRLSAIAGEPLPEPTGRELLTRAQRLLGAGKPGAAVAQADAATKLLQGVDAAEAQLA